MLFLCIGPDAGHQLLIRRHGRVDFLRQAYLWGIARYFLLRQILHPLNLLNSLRQPATPIQNACHPVLRVPLCLRVLNRTIGSSDPAFINLEIWIRISVFDAMSTSVFRIDHFRLVRFLRSWVLAGRVGVLLALSRLPVGIGSPIPAPNAEFIRTSCEEKRIIHLNLICMKLTNLVLCCLIELKSILFIRKSFNFIFKS